MMMFWEYVSHMSFVLIVIIGSIVALLYTYMRRAKRRAR
ncbi:MAG: EYxxD motif small membrane protein [Bacillus sp. (in: firmicutes)]